MGARLLGADRGNERGHFEDLQMVDFHRAALKANGHDPDGYLSEGTVSVPPALEAEGRRLVAERAGAPGVWGWKDPRTVLFLDFWERVLGQPRYVFMFRSPWGVVGSLLRRGDEAFEEDPVFAARVWLHYNRSILDTVRQIGRAHV